MRRTNPTLIIIDEVANYVGWDIGSGDKSILISAHKKEDVVILDAVFELVEIPVNAGGPTAGAFGPPETKSQRRSRERQAMGKGGKMKGWQW